MSEHTWFQENLASYAAGGLTPEERDRAERHADLCPECAGDLARWRDVEGKLDDLFIEVRPAAGLEDRMIRKLRRAPAPRRFFRFPLVRFALGAAALLFVGAVGAVLYGLADLDDLAFPGAWELAAARTQSSNHLKQLSVPLQDDMQQNTQIAAGQIGQSPIPDVATSNMKISLSREDLGIVQQQDGRALDRMADLAALRKHNLAPAKAPSNSAAVRPQGESLDSKDKNGETLAESHFGFKVEQPSSNRTVFKNINPEYYQTFPMDREKRGYFRPKASIDKSEKTPPTTEKFEDRLREEIVVAQKDKKEPAAQKPKGGEPAALGRKIIRTGDIEFEVDSFDKAVERINALITATAGAFIATTNSDKLPNGKVKGSVVVRVPPASLDKFLAELRKDLGKMGDLRSQRIGSQDISKQYTDIESRLRAARTIEERLLKIIKDGKGEIKDLVAAEHELGTWRTKIEEMEGEIRYYNNQVSLSTLTISLYEKEIRAPSALVVTERVTMRVETEDVEKAQQAAVKAVTDAGGRVTKSELKQHAAGQLQAIVQAEVAPAAAGGVRARFKELGLVTKLDLDRLQQAEGGSGNLGDIKTRQKDVQLNLTLYNVADVQPRETFTIQIATLDVPGSFKKLQDAVARAKGQVRKGQLNEQDKLNITAEFDFDILTQDKKAIDKALEEAGRTLARSTQQAPPAELVTNSKVGYRLVLRDVAGIPARERITLGIEVANVKETADEFKDLVRSAKGLVKADRRSLEANGKITDVLLFDVPLSARNELVRKFEAAGKVRVQQNIENPQVPANDLATAQIDITLTNVGPIVPSNEGLWPQIRTSLFYSFKVLSWSVMFIILGLSVVLPWALVIWGVYRVVRRVRRRTIDN